MLDADALDVFYRQLQELFDFLDQRDSIEEQKKIHEQVVSIRMRDDSDKADDNTEFLIQTL
ncbi:MAG TPA: hypothetical protein PK765_01155 [bacterium]|nr:hypothetical protein [bacterium]